ncbi:MAG: DUF1553 domain-containing protein [Planctomycetes bacterium]|nr:DUF1553 domain-containing protein [Planctomycetota bacterium]
MRLMFFFAALSGLLTIAQPSQADDAADAAFFETKVRPVLIAKCHECHGREKPKAGLRMDSREALLTGGESGPAAVPGKPDESLLVDVIGYRNTVQMPPKAKLPDAEIATLTEWIRRGLPWPNSQPTPPAVTTTGQTADFSDEQKQFWAFQPIRKSLPPPVKNEAWIRSPIDGFVLAELESKGLPVAREANRRTLIRRVTLDLIGLPPTPDEVAEFVADDAPDALERLVDRLLASPRYGERWARHWLDIARYADSNGLDENLAYANACHYRDYVVRVMREDKPYDQFLIEQIAGDLLEPVDSPQPSFDPLIATGFLCLGAKMLAEDDPVKMQMDIIDEQVDTIGRAVMGLTMGCARCHDHKFDPITTEDYYGLAGIFKSTQTMDTFSVVARWHERPLATLSQLKQRDELQQLATAQKQVVDTLKGNTTESILAQARRQAATYLLAATHDYLLADALKGAKPRGNEPNLQSIAGAILLEAEDYARGNVLKDRETYGQGIGVLVNRGETPNFTEYDINVERGTTYQLELRYAAAGSRPVKVSLNGHLVKSDAARQVTGSWTPESQTWFVEGFVTLNAGRNVIRLEQPTFFPHIDKLLLTPAEIPAAGPDEVVPATDTVETNLIPSLRQQWLKVLESSKSDPRSILAAWHQYVASKQLTVDPALPNGIAQLLGDSQPTTLKDLGNRYQRLFNAAQQAWTDLKATDAGKDATQLPDPVLEAARLVLMDPKGPFAVPADIEASFPADVIAQLKLGREELARRDAAVPKFAETMAVAESKPENLKIHLRGSHLTLGREVPRQIPRILAGSGSRELSDGSGRLQLARWLANREHPLTARVMINRLWQWHFGQGLVRSPDNFGRLGERPTHPALLDWLASEFSGKEERTPSSWSLKAAHRRLICTATYRQSTEFHEAAALVDPENRLLWRFNRQRMDVEVLRDSLLAISGKLDETPGGSMLPTPNRAYVTSTANVNPAVYSSNRRSIYLPVVRSALFDVFTAFDFADPSTLAGQRDQTTVAPQALFMMNSGFVLEQVTALADRLLDRTDLDRAARIRLLYAVAYSRDPSEAEVSRGLGYLDRLRSALNQAGVAANEIERRAWVSFTRAVLSANEFVYVE